MNNLTELKNVANVAVEAAYTIYCSKVAAAYSADDLSTEVAADVYVVALKKYVDTTIAIALKELIS